MKKTGSSVVLLWQLMNNIKGRKKEEIDVVPQLYTHQKESRRDGFISNTYLLRSEINSAPFFFLLQFSYNTACHQRHSC